MDTLIEWLGKADDLSIQYDAGILKTQMLAGDIALDNTLPAIIYPSNENIRDVTDVVWEKEVSKADQLDYIMAVCSGTVAGLIDVFFVGEFSLERANKWGAEKTNSFVMKVAKMQGYKGDDLADAISLMEKKYGLAADQFTPEFGGGLQHHLRDFSHHFSLGGLLCSLFTQFSGMVIGTDTSGALRIEKVKDTTFIGKNFEEKILFGTIHWFYHMVSDMAGSSMSPGKGTGIPGPIVSLIKELSALPCFKDKQIGEHEFHVWVSKLFNGTLLAKRDENGKIIEALKFDLRTEIGILHEIGRQFIPVIINECLVRGLYFFRRLIEEIKEKPIHSFSDFQNLDAAKLLPFNNRIIKRMITVASGTFTAIDAVDATIRAAIASKGFAPAFFVQFAVRINVVGVGRFVIACKADSSYISEDIKEAKEKRDRIRKEYEKLISDFSCLSLSYEQTRVLYSLERLIIQEDIRGTKKPEEMSAKIEWLTEWQKDIVDGLSLIPTAKDNFFLSESEVLESIQNSPSEPWLYLMAMEAILFKPFYPIYADSEKNKEAKKLKYKAAYLTESFAANQEKLSAKDLSALEKSYKQSARIITGSNKNLIIGVAATTVLVAATGGLAFTFAPAIATAIVGDAAAGLSGAALVSYSLAAVGGGSLAAGGLGMAGGTAIITGGGALLGMLSGTGISAATTVSLLSDEGYVLSECCKLLTYSKEILFGKYKDAGTIFSIKAKIESRSLEVANQIDVFDELIDQETDGEKKKEMKIKVKVAKKSLKYLNRTAVELGKLVKSSDKELATQLLLPGQ